MLNRVQIAVLAFGALVWFALVIVLIAAPQVYGSTLRNLPSPRAAYYGLFLAALSIFLLILGFGVIRRWRWAFWLVLISFLAGGLRVPVSMLQLSALVPTDLPRWYIALQALIGAVQFALGMVMLFGYRRGGVWGDP